MHDIDRRQLLGLGAALLVASSRTSRAAEPPAPPALPVPTNWQRAQRLPLWTGMPPGAETYAAPQPPSDWPDSYVRSVSMPELRVFRPARPNGRSLLVMPGGAYWFVSVVNEGADLAPRLTARGYTVFVLTYRLPGEGWAARSDVPLQMLNALARVAKQEEFEIHALIESERPLREVDSGGAYNGVTVHFAADTEELVAQALKLAKSTSDQLVLIEACGEVVQAGHR